jgi:hypothetical protein
MLYVPKNYNELIEFFNDAASRYYDNKDDVDVKA